MSPNRKTNANRNPNPNPNQGEIFLGSNCSDTGLKVLHCCSHEGTSHLFIYSFTYLSIFKYVCAFVILRMTSFQKKRYYSILKRATETRVTLNLVLFAIMLMSTGI